MLLLPVSLAGAYFAPRRKLPNYLSMELSAYAFHRPFNSQFPCNLVYMLSQKIVIKAACPA